MGAVGWGRGEEGLVGGEGCGAVRGEGFCGGGQGKSGDGGGGGRGFGARDVER